MIAVPIVTGRKNTPETGLGLLQAGKHLLEIIKFRSSGDTNVSAGQSTWKINTAGHYGKGCYMCVFAKKVELAALQACGLQMSPLLREIYWSFLLLEMRKLLVATSVLCTFTAEEQPPAPIGQRADAAAYSSEPSSVWTGSECSTQIYWQLCH